MNWTIDKPAGIGWYYFRETDRTKFRPIEIVWANYCGPTELWQREETEMRPLDNVEREGGEWAGPLPMPEEG